MISDGKLKIGDFGLGKIVILLLNLIYSSDWRRHELGYGA